MSSPEAEGRQRPAADNPWVCPNDRQLALRAKLRSGWSVKTSDLQRSRRPKPLDECEQHAIVDVIQKAESLEKKEQLRIGKLVDRLENMRRHAIGNGATTCVLCGEKFGLLASHKHKCRDCDKAVCHKCVVETSAAGEQCMLCKICSESREVWKKSGAWFFKGMPRYIRPEPRSPARSLALNGGGGRRPMPTADSAASPCTSPSDSSPTGTKYNWARHVQPSASGICSSSSRSLLAGDGRHGAPANDAALLADGRSSATWTTHELVTSVSSSGLSARTPTGSGSPAGVSCADQSSSEDEETLHRPPVRRVTTYQTAIPQVMSSSRLTSDSGASLSGSTRSLTSKTEQIAVHRSRSAVFSSAEIQQNTRIRPAKIRSSRSHTSLNIFSVATPPAERVRDRQPGPNRDRSHGDHSVSLEQTGGRRGTIDFTLMLDPRKGSLHCCVHRINGLCPTPVGHVSNGYVKLHIVPGLAKTNKLRTRAVTGTGEREFLETLTYCNISTDVLTTGSLLLTVLEEEAHGHDVVGEARLLLAEVPPRRLLTLNRPLLPLTAPELSCSVECGSGAAAGRARGRILLSLKYVTSRQCLLVGVVRCADLRSRHAQSCCCAVDAFVKVHLRPGDFICSTQMRCGYSNPAFNEEFAFVCRRSELPKRTLYLSVLDKDISNSNDFIGGVRLSIDARGAKLRHWFDALQYVDTRHDRWHKLSLQVPNSPTHPTHSICTIDSERSHPQGGRHREQQNGDQYRDQHSSRQQQEHSDRRDQSEQHPRSCGDGPRKQSRHQEFKDQNDRQVRKHRDRTELRGFHSHKDQRQHKEHRDHHKH